MNDMNNSFLAAAVPRHMPSPITASLVVGGLCAGIGLLFKRSPVKFGLVGAGSTFALVTAAEMGYVAGIARTSMLLEEGVREGRIPSPVATSGWGY